MRKGLGYIDWAISVGLFLILVSLIFIFFGPLLNQEFSEDYLNTIVKDGIEKQSSITLKKFPLYFETSSTEEIIEISNPDAFKDLTSINSFATTTLGARLDFTILNNRTAIKLANINTSGVNTYYIYSSKELSVTNNFPSGTGPNNGNVSIGIPEEITGLYDPFFTSRVLNLNYSQLKDSFNFPTNRDFTIEIFNDSQLNSVIYEYKKLTPPATSSVYTLLYSKNHITIGNELIIKPIYIRIKSW